MPTKKRTAGQNLPSTTFNRARWVTMRGELERARSAIDSALTSLGVMLEIFSGGTQAATVASSTTRRHGVRRRRTGAAKGPQQVSAAKRTAASSGEKKAA